MAAKQQKSQKEWQLQWDRGKYSVRNLYDKGFRPRSNRARMAVYEYKYYGMYYAITLILTPDEYDELKGCFAQVAAEEEYAQDREEWERYEYLKEKFGGE